MFQLYICITIVILAIAVSVGLVSGIHFRPPENYTDREIYEFAGEVSIMIIISAIGIISLLAKTETGKKIGKKLIKNKNEEEEEEDEKFFE